MVDLITKSDVDFCIDLAKQLSNRCATKKGIHMAKLHLLLGLFNYSINFATIKNVSEEKIKQFLGGDGGS